MKKKNRRIGIWFLLATLVLRQWCNQFASYSAPQLKKLIYVSDFDFSHFRLALSNIFFSFFFRETKTSLFLNRESRAENEWRKEIIFIIFNSMRWIGKWKITNKFFYGELVFFWWKKQKRRIFRLVSFRKLYLRVVFCSTTIYSVCFMLLKIFNSFVLFYFLSLSSSNLRLCGVYVFKNQFCWKIF